MSDTQLDTTVSQTKRINLADIAASQGATLQQQAAPVALERPPAVALSDEDQARAHEIARGIDFMKSGIESTYARDAQRSMMDSELADQEKLQTSDEWLSLTSTACHCDLFRNNTLIAGHGTPEAHVAGVFDFYFAGTTPWLYDLAVTVNDWCIDPETGLLDAERVRALMDAYNRVRPLSQTEKGLWRGALRAAAMRFWMSRLFDFYLPRKASLLKPLDPTHFERVLRDRMTCSLYWPQ